MKQQRKLNEARSVVCVRKAGDNHRAAAAAMVGAGRAEVPANVLTCGAVAGRSTRGELFVGSRNSFADAGFVESANRPYDA